MTTDKQNSEVLISVRGLTKHFNGGDLQALRGVDTDIRRGEVLVVIGPSGSGKSTFLRCLNLLELPTAGTITLAGTDITDPKVDINLHRQKMGMVFQHFNLFPHMTVLAPRDTKELRGMIDWAVSQDGPCAILYPRAIPEIPAPEATFVPGRWETMREGADVCLLSYSSILAECLGAADILAESGIQTMVVNASQLNP